MSEAEAPFIATPADQAAWEKFKQDALEIPERAQTTRCRSSRCDRPVWMGLTRKNQKPNAFDVLPDGTLTATSHWRTCQDRERFRKR